MFFWYGIEVDGKTITKSTTYRDSLPFEIDVSEMDETFRGELIFSPPLKHEVKEIHIGNHSWAQIFNRQEDGRLLFTCQDFQVGLTKKTGIIILISDDGQEVELPFEFEYYNQ